MVFEFLPFKILNIEERRKNVKQLFTDVALTFYHLKIVSKNPKININWAGRYYLLYFRLK